MTQVTAISSSDSSVMDNLRRDSSAFEISQAMPIKPYLAADYVLDLGHGQEQGVRELATKVFGDQNGSDDKLEVSQLKGGITNMLLKGKYIRGSEQYEFLVRAYGNGTSTIIDRDREFATHLSLHNLSLAPPLYSRFANGLFYGFIPGRATDYRELSDPEIMRAVSNRLAEWHAKLDSTTIEKSIEQIKSSLKAPAKFPRNVWSLLDKWLATFPSGVVSHSVDDLRHEINWIQKCIGNIGPNVVGHCDLLCGNILVPPTWESSQDNAQNHLIYNTGSTSDYKPSTLATFIDYEYALPVPRGFDLANHFMEWQGFDCVTDLIPEPSKDNKVMRYWCFHYLSAFKQFAADKNQSVTEQDIDDLIDEIIAWWGMPGFYWGIWAAIQSKISDIDFDYASYANSRLNEYFAWKANMYPKMDLS